MWDLAGRRVSGRTVTISDNQGVDAAAFSPDGRTLATTTFGTDNRSGMLQLWHVTDPHTLTPVATVSGSQDISEIAFSPDGRTLAATIIGGRGINSGGTLQLWDVTGRRAPTLTANITEQQAVEAVAFSPDGRTLATTTFGTDNRGGMMELWNVSNRRAPARTATVPDIQDLGAVAFSPDGRTLATTASSGTAGMLQLWDVTDRRAPARTATVPDTQDLGAVAFSPDGRTLATTTISGSMVGSGMLQLWDVTDRRAPTLTANITNSQSVYAVAFSPDGHTLATIMGNAGSVQLWDAAWVVGLSGHMHDWACHAAGGDLTADDNEWSRLASGVPYKRAC